MVNRKRKIFIHNFEMMASIGVYENEKKNKQKKKNLPTGVKCFFRPNLSKKQ